MLVLTRKLDGINVIDDNHVNALLEYHPRSAIPRLESLVRTRSFGRVRDLRLELSGEGLILHGRATSYYVKQLAQQAVLEAGSLSLLANEIEVTIERETKR